MLYREAALSSHFRTNARNDLMLWVVSAGLEGENEDGRHMGERVTTDVNPRPFSIPVVDAIVTRV